MKKRFLSFLVSLIVSATAQSVSAEKPVTVGAVDLFLQGCHLDTPIPDGEWYGLYLSTAGTVSNVSKVSVKTTKKPAGVDDLLDYCVQTRPTSKIPDMQQAPIVLVAGAMIKEGRFNTARFSKSEFAELKGGVFSGDAKLPPTDEDIEITFNKKKYRLHQFTNLDDHAKGDNHILTLSHNGRKQTILSVHGNYEGGTRLKILWAGDLDRDGNLDLILNAPVHYAQRHHLRIYLSSLAKKDELVAQAGERGFDGI